MVVEIGAYDGPPLVVLRAFKHPIPKSFDVPRGIVPQRVGGDIKAEIFQIDAEPTVFVRLRNAPNH